ncbi:MAG: hypothetical protein WC794_03775 [Candidatus Doudnabacteria bacterium]
MANFFVKMLGSNGWNLLPTKLTPVLFAVVKLRLSKSSHFASSPSGWALPNQIMVLNLAQTRKS